jgi:hypothetical protein
LYTSARPVATGSSRSIGPSISAMALGKRTVEAPIIEI